MLAFICLKPEPRQKLNLPIGAHNTHTTVMQFLDFSHDHLKPPVLVSPMLKKKKKRKENHHKRKQERFWGDTNSKNHLTVRNCQMVLP